MGRLEAPFEFRARPCRYNAVAANCNAAILDDPPLRVHRDHVAGGPQPIGWLSHTSAHCQKKEGTTEPALFLKAGWHRMVSETDPLIAWSRFVHASLPAPA